MNEPFDKTLNKIIPAVLPTSTSDLDSKLSQIPDEIKLVHIDVLEEDVWSGSIERDFEVHLMVEKPEKIIERWVNRGAKKIIVHKLTPEILKWKGQVEIGLAVEMHIPLEEVYPQIPHIDFVQLMSIEKIGAQGYPLSEKIFDRIETVRDQFPELIISVDGGVNVTNIDKLRSLGVNKFVSGSGFKDLWKSQTKN